MIRISVFGFSRGATLARAFVRELQGQCKLNGAQFLLEGFPCEVMFLGLFDTVASVGMPMSANNTPLASSLGWYDLTTTLKIRATANTNDITRIAFGAPGADPAPGSFDGHGSWADGLQVSQLVKRCVHMVAAHEIRNSFPLDSVLDGMHYPTNTQEMVYPGVHSDVGGGYQPSEGGRSAHYGDMVSLISLRAMHELACAAGVPLRSLKNLREDSAKYVLQSFALDPEGERHYSAMLTRWQHYMQLVGKNKRSLGDEVLAHTYWLFGWRFARIRQRQKTGASVTEKTIRENEAEFAKERAAIKTSADERKKIWFNKFHDLDVANQRYEIDRLTAARIGRPKDPLLAEQREIARREEAEARDAYYREQARLDTYADDSKLIANMQAYDKRLIEDAHAIMMHIKYSGTKLPLRPHYQNLVNAYQDFYLNGKPYDAIAGELFDLHIHDSLAGFAQDATLSSDPRVLYAGGDNKIRYAMLESQDAEEESVA